MKRWTDEEIAYHDRVVAQRAARRAEVNRLVEENWAERRGGLYRVADRCFGESEEALVRGRCRP